MVRFGFGLEKLGTISLARPGTALAVVFLTCLMAAYGLTFLAFDGDPGEVFRANNAVSRATDRQVKAFPSNGEQLVLLIESKNTFSARQLEAIRTLHLEMQFIDGVNGVSSIFSPREKADADGNTPTILPADLPEDKDIPALLGKLYHHPLAGDLLLSKDLTTSLMIISFERTGQGLSGVSQSLDKVTELSDLIAKAVDLRVTQTGVMAIRYDVLKSLYQDVHMLNLSGSILAILICFVFFRNFQLVIIASLPPVVAVLWVLGMFGLTGHPVTAMNNVLPTLVLVIAFCDALHMVQTIRRRIAAGDDVKQAVAVSVRDVGPACAMTSLTTMVACSSLMLSSSNAVREFGTSGTVSVFFAFVAVIIMVPAMSMLMLKKRQSEAVSVDRFNQTLDRVSSATWKIVNGHTKLIVYTSLAALVVSGYAYFSTTTNYDYRKFLSQSSPANHAIDVIDKKFGGADVFNILVETKEPSSTPPPALIAAHRTLESLDGIRAVFSFTTVLDWLGRVDVKNRQEMEELLEKLPPGFRSRVVSKDGKSWLMTVYIPNQTAAQTRHALRHIENQLAPVRKKYPDTSLSLSGGIARSALSSPIVIGGLKFSLGVAVLITILMVGIFVRSLRFAVLSAVPNLLPLTLVALALFVTGNSFSLIGVLALTIAFGIAIDNTIHVVNRLQIEMSGKSLKTAMANTIAKTAPVLFAATMLLISGMIVTRFSQLPSIRIFGAYMTAVLVLALFAAIVVLPAIILETDRSGDAQGDK
jgi:predicted RND superfamily exporter protein